MPSRHAMYSKIIHKQLNTMSVNEKWAGAENKCPVCLNAKEDWWHLLVCQSPDMIRVRDKLMNDFEANLLGVLKTLLVDGGFDGRVPLFLLSPERFTIQIGHDYWMFLERRIFGGRYFSVNCEN